MGIQARVCYPVKHRRRVRAAKSKLYICTFVACFVSAGSVLLYILANMGPVHRGLLESVFVVTVGTPDTVVCQPKLVRASCVDCEWCVPPADGYARARACHFDKWLELLSHLRVPDLGGHHMNEFSRGGRIGLQQKREYMCGTYLAHLDALQDMCGAFNRRKTPRFGIVLESDVDVRWRRVELQVEAIAAIMRSHSTVTVFNLGVTTPLCTQPHRESGIHSGRCFVEHVFGSWGTTAVGYNLSSACSDEYLIAQQKLVGCVPSDVGLYSNAGGFQSSDASIPFFRVHTHGFASNSGDEIHAALNHTYRQAEAIWNVTSVETATSSCRRRQNALSHFPTVDSFCKNMS